MRTLLLGMACLTLLTAAACRGTATTKSPAATAPQVSSAALAADASTTDEAAAPRNTTTSTSAAAVGPRLPQIARNVTAPAPVRVQAAALPPFTSARQALVLDEASAGILYAKGANVRTQPASLTKIATAIVAIEHGNLDRVVTVDVDARNFTDSTLMGLRPGDRFSVRDLLYGLMLASGNDAAVAVGRAVSGSDAAFVAEMNQLVDRLALQDTHFINPHGLDEPGHYTSPYDIAMIARYGMTLPDFRQIVDAQSYVANGSRTIRMDSLISGLLRWVPGATGVKSGYTDNAGRTLVLSADRDGRRVYSVVMNDPDREMDGANLLEWAFANHRWQPATTPPAPAVVSAPSAPTPADADIVRAAREGR